MLRMGWDHGVEMLFDKRGILDSIGFRINKYHPYTAGLPAGLKETDSKEDLERKLGPPDSENTVKEDYTNRKRQYFKSKHLTLEWRIDGLLGRQWEYVRFLRKAP